MIRKDCSRELTKGHCSVAVRILLIKIAVKCYVKLYYSLLPSYAVNRLNQRTPVVTDY